MRRWLIAAGFLVAASAGAALFARARLDDYVATHRDAFAARASTALGRSVRFDTCSVSLWGGLSVDLSNLRIADDPGFAEGDFFRAATAELEVPLLGALLGTYRMRRLVLEDIDVALIRDERGWNVDSLVTPPPSPPAADGAAAGASSTASLQGGALPTITALVLRGGQVRAIDRRQAPPLVFALDALYVSATDLGPNETTGLAVSAAIFGSATPNLHLSGRLTLSSPPIADVEAQWGELALAALEPYVAALAGRAPQGTVSGNLRLRGPLTIASLPALTGTVDLRNVGLTSVELPVRIGELSGTLRFGDDAIELVDGTARFGAAPVAMQCRGAPPAAPLLECQLRAPALRPQDLGLPGRRADALRDLAVTARLRPRDVAPVVDAEVRIDSGQWYGAPFRDATATARLQRGHYVLEALRAMAFDGSLRMDGTCHVPSDAVPTCNLHALVDGMQVGPLLASQDAGPDHLTGRLDTDIRLSAGGGDVQALRASVRGGGPLTVRDGVLRRVNLAKLVLGALPGVGTLFGDADTTTPFQELRATVHIADERVVTDDVHLTSADFTVDGRGSISFAGALDLSGTLTTGPALGRSVVGRVPVLGRLADRSGGALTVPFVVGGTVQDPRVRPDSNALARAVGHGAAAAIDALLGTPERARDTVDRLLHR